MGVITKKLSSPTLNIAGDTEWEGGRENHTEIRSVRRSESRADKLTQTDRHKSKEESHSGQAPTEQSKSKKRSTWQVRRSI